DLHPAFGGLHPHPHRRARPRGDLTPAPWFPRSAWEPSPRRGASRQHSAADNLFRRRRQSDAERRKRRSHAERGNEDKGRSMKILKVEKLTDERWLNLFSATYEHNGHNGRWVYASRKPASVPGGPPDAVVIVPVLHAEGQPPRL